MTAQEWDSPTVEQSLSKQSHSALFANNGREALEVFAEHQPALVIADWTMPDISGLELCQRIRHDFQQQYAYLILLTSNTNKEHVIEALAAGTDDYLTKPFHPGEPVARVGVGRRMIELHRQVEAKKPSAITQNRPTRVTSGTLISAEACRLLARS